MEDDLYSILGVSKNATQNDITSAYAVYLAPTIRTGVSMLMRSSPPGRTG